MRHFVITMAMELGKENAFEVVSTKCAWRGLSSMQTARFPPPPPNPPMV